MLNVAQRQYLIPDLILVNCNEDVSFDVVTSQQTTLSSTHMVYSVISGMQLNMAVQMPVTYFLFSYM